MVTLDPAVFKQRYPQYDSLTDEQIDYLFELANALIDQSIFSSDAKATTIMYVLTAHLAYINYKDSSGNGGGGQVGMVKDAEEEAVSVSFDAGTVPFSRFWFMQSPFGVLLLQLLKPYLMGQVFKPCE